ncbi:FHA domain-containing protein [Nannocystis radixulma]|uniref:FHA domain-containing protein n=1 Tax=Nannocystis radixulma TaxID=2995305 RepID=A0ABT5BJT0_9BACT|nr:FHA domain-containing protein [Nannocystis radixulma]MDC0673799.1 FHA domain-containing protein [Nannocystis radixulma]
MAGPSGETLALVWSGAEPAFVPLASDGDRWVIGRDTPGIADSRMSRRHCEVERRGASWRITDLGSANGTSVDGKRVEGTLTFSFWRVLQVGRSLVVRLRYREGAQVVAVDGGFVGPSLASAWETTAVAAREGSHVMLVGWRGAGVEFLARHYARCRGRADEAFTVVPDSHTLPREAAAMLSSGVVFAPDAEFESPWLAAALGRADLRLCVGFEDRVRRWGDPPRKAPHGFTSVTVPPLMERPDEIPWRIAQAVRRIDPALAVDVTLVELCLLHDWYGGIPELERACAEAVAAAKAAGKTVLKARELARFETHWEPGKTLWEKDDQLPFVSGAPRTGHRALASRENLAWQWRETGGDVARIAAALDVTPEAVAQWIRRHGIDPQE